MVLTVRLVGTVPAIACRSQLLGVKADVWHKGAAALKILIKHGAKKSIVRESGLEWIFKLFRVQAIANFRSVEGDEIYS